MMYSALNYGRQTAPAVTNASQRNHPGLTPDFPLSNMVVDQLPGKQCNPSPGAFYQKNVGIPVNGTAADRTAERDRGFRTEWRKDRSVPQNSPAGIEGIHTVPEDDAYTVNTAVQSIQYLLSAYFRISSIFNLLARDSTT